MTAGEIYTSAVIVHLVDEKNTFMTTINSGFVSLSLKSAEPSSAVLKPEHNSYPIVNGIAQCGNFVIDKAGKDYRLSIYSALHNSITETTVFEVRVGPAYKLLLDSDSVSAFGGTAFHPQPIISVVDRGGNIVQEITASVRVELSQSTSRGQLLPTANVMANVSNGRARFSGLYITAAGCFYRMRYTIDHYLVGGSIVETKPLCVQPGQGRILQVIQSPSAAIGGCAFSTQPVLKVTDAGGNVPDDEAQNLVRISLSPNPYNGKIQPEAFSTAKVQRGLAVFRNLNIDKAGSNYTLSFALYKTNDTGDLMETSISILSPGFDVAVGSPARISVEPLLYGFSDGEPMRQQPHVEILDAGGNLVSTSTTVVDTVYVPSMAITTSVSVNSIDAPPVVVQKVDVKPLPSFTTPYGAGTILFVRVTFSDEVLATGTPSLILAASSLPSVATCVTLSTWSRHLLFQYTVSPNDLTNALQYASATSLIPNGGEISDRNGIPATLTLPPLDSPASLIESFISIDTSTPFITSIQCSTPDDGEYGVGETIYIQVKYSAEVAVYGLPFLFVILDNVGGSDPARRATLSGGNNTSTIVFSYVVQQGDQAGILDVRPVIELNGGSIKRYSMEPSTVAASMMDISNPNTLRSLNQIRIDTTDPKVDSHVGVTSDSVDGIYCPGDIILIQVTFTKPVMVQGLPRLYLESGPIKQPADYFSGNRSFKLTFRYTVAVGDRHDLTGNSFLNYRDDNALELNGGSIQRYIRHGYNSSDAQTSLSESSQNHKSLYENARILLDSATPSINSISAGNTVGVTVYPGDSVPISITFTSPVVVNTDKGTPRISLFVGQIERFAEYNGGSGTSVLTFLYKVRLGDQAIQGMTYTTRRAITLCGATIRRKAQMPIVDAALLLSTPIINAPNIDPGIAESTSIESLWADVPLGSYGVNHVIRLNLTFTSEVVVTGTPTLLLNSQATALYISGSKSITLIFQYIVGTYDTTLRLNKLDDASIVCNSDCNIVNFNGAPVSSSLEGVDVMPSGINIDPTAPMVSRVYSTTLVPSVNGGMFVIGDVIDIIVEWSSPVTIVPAHSTRSCTGPTLFLNTSQDGQKVPCRGFFEGNRKLLWFTYVIQSGDEHMDLTYESNDALSFGDEQCSIKRFSSIPTTFAILALPMPPIPFGQWQNQLFRINTTFVPHVLSITSPLPDGIYKCGDVITIDVEFSGHVTVQGFPVLWLNAGSMSLPATYSAGSGSTTLRFLYIIEENDYSMRLDYRDSHSLDTIHTADDHACSIFQQADIPSVTASLKLPLPSTPGSLGHNKKISVDGRKPIIELIQVVGSDRDYTFGEIVTIEIVFSSPVYVTLGEGAVRLKLSLHSRDTGLLLNRYADYVGQNNNKTTLYFEYTVRRGDYASQLDYYDTSSLTLDGDARILTQTSDTAGTAIQDADIHLNPPGRRFHGTKHLPVVRGATKSTDIFLDGPGNHYRIYFQMKIEREILRAWTHVIVSHSSVYALRPPTGNILGTSVAIHNNTIVVGAQSNRFQEVISIQSLTLTSNVSSYINEVQEISTRATQRPLVQKLLSDAAENETIDGWFMLSIGTGPTSRRIYYNYHPIQIAVIIEIDLRVGKNTVSVSREINNLSKSRNAFVWTITFLSSEGPFEALAVAFQSLTGAQAVIGDGQGTPSALVISKPTILSGSFTLKYDAKETRSIPVDAESVQLAAILLDDLGLSVEKITRTQPSAMMELTWIITFKKSEIVHEYQQLVSKGEGLIGYGAMISTRTLTNCQVPPSGTFRIDVRMNGLPTRMTEDIPVDASARHLEQVISGVAPMYQVAVTRLTKKHAMIWKITFTKKEDRAASSIESIPSLSPVIIVKDSDGREQKLFHGTNVRISVHVDQMYPPYQDGRKGSGSIITYARDEGIWKQAAVPITGSDTRLDDGFGSSIALYQDVILVGAPYAAAYADFGSVSIICDADAGSFIIQNEFRSTERIPFNANRQILQQSLSSLWNVPENSVIVSYFTSLCSNTPIRIVKAFGRGYGRNDVLTIDKSSLYKQGSQGIINVIEESSGSFHLDGQEVQGSQAGAAYIFKKMNDGNWNQTAKLQIPATDIIFVREFGASVTIFETFGVVGAPASSNNTGRVYIYQYIPGNDSWILLQTLQTLLSLQPRRFGEAIAISGKSSKVTIAIGAPGSVSSPGSVFIYDYDINQNRYNLQQELSQTHGYAGDFFGCDVALDMTEITTLVVGSNTRAAFVFVREDPGLIYFTMETMLVGFNTSPNDRFGRKVSVSRNIIIVNALESPKSTHTLSDPIQHIRIATIDSSPYDSYGEDEFRLSCRKVQDVNKRKKIVRLETQPIKFNVDVSTMEAILHQDLLIEAVSVSRTTDLNGISWLLTFGADQGASLLNVEETTCGFETCTVPRIKTEWVQQPSPRLDNSVYVFERSNHKWTEQATLRPRFKQLNNYGAAIAIYGRTAIIGDHPAGDAFVFDLNVLALGFSSETYTVIEGDPIKIPVIHRALLAKDVNALRSADVYISHEPEDDSSRKLVWNESHAVFNDIEKKKEASLWHDGTYDNAGLSDYVVDSKKLYFENIGDGISQSFEFKTIDDYALEEPDEKFTLRLFSPGIHPSPPGSLWSTLTIQDNGDGGSGTRISLGILHAGKSRQLMAEFGACVSVCDIYGIALIGAPKERFDVDGRTTSCGAVYTFVLRVGYWELHSKLVPPECLEGQEFGASVALDCTFESLRAIIGSPGRHPHAVIYKSQKHQPINWILESRLTHNLASASSHRYGGPRTVGLWGDLAVVGAVGLEKVFVYHRGILDWAFISEITCVDRVVHRVLEDEFQSTFYFGFSVSVSDRMIAVGAPLATAQAVKENDDVKADRTYLSKGAVYLCSLQAQRQTIELRADTAILYGEFRLTLMYRGDRKTTQRLGFISSARDVGDALRHLNLLHRIKVSKMSDNLTHQWMLTFWDAFMTVPLLEASWKGFGCDECQSLSSAYVADPSDQIHVEERKMLGEWECETRLEAPDGNFGDRFGSSIDLDDDLLIIGAPASNALTTTTWDFETGDLTGWLTTGTAFDQQPTFGDNVYDRVSTYDYGLYSLESIGQRAYPQGRYWVGTYEARPGRGKNSTELSLCSFPGSQCRASNYTLPGENRAGSIQGDGPQGKLCSQPFVIHGNWISFKLGGGCDILVLYAELRVGGTTEYKQTGKCREKMELVRWNVATFQTKSAQLCVVDASSSQYWGHINFDDVQFDWDISHQFAATPNAGAAYIFSRSASECSDSLCDESIYWKLESRLTSTDKQSGDEFSFDVAIDSSSGFAVVSAPGHGLYREADRIFNEENQMGSTYVFQRSQVNRDQNVDATSDTRTRAQWTPYEIVKLQSIHQQSNSRYGHAIDMSGSTLLSGAPLFSQASVSNPIGQVFAYDINFLHIGFASSLFHCVEGRGTEAIVIVKRFSQDVNQVIAVAYATEDENARGASATKCRDCQAKLPDERKDCPDYQHVAGELVLPAGRMFAKIQVPIVDNKCRELDTKFFKIRLYVIGGEPLLGERYTTRVRIDDDDFGLQVC